MTELDVGDIQKTNIKETPKGSDILRATFTDPTFISHITELIHHARINRSEGSFYVLNNNGEPLISELNKSPRLESYESRADSFQTNPFANPYVLLLNNPSSLIFTLHSHPCLPHFYARPPEDTLVPSDQDFNSWEIRKLLTHNQKIIEGILVAKGKSGLILLYQSTSETSNNYQSLGEHTSLPTLLRAFDESRIRYEILSFDPGHIEFPSTELEKLKKFEI